MKRQQGFSIIEVVLVLAIIGLVGLVGYNLYNMQLAKTNQQPAVTPVAQSPATPPARINNVGDINASAKALDALDIDTNNDTTTLTNSIAEL